MTAKEAIAWKVSRIVGAVLLWLVLSVPVAHAQEPTPLERIHEAFAQGDARALLEQAAERVEVVLLGQSRQYSRSQAVYVMDEFFREYPPEQFELADTSGSNGSQFAASQYWSNREEAPLQVYIHLRQSEERWLIREIRIERRRR